MNKLSTIQRSNITKDTIDIKVSKPYYATLKFFDNYRNGCNKAPYSINHYVGMNYYCGKRPSDRGSLFSEIPKYNCNKTICWKATSTLPFYRLALYIDDKKERKTISDFI